MATLEQIQARMKKLQAQAEALLAKRAQAAVDQIRELMIKHGLTTADIEARAKAKREAKASGHRLGNGVAKHAASAKGKMPPKYRDPKTGATWSGHARPPAWIKDVKDRTRYLIDQTAAVALNGSGASIASAAVKKTPAKNATARKTPAKKAAAKPVAARKVTAKKAATKHPAAKRATVKKAAAKKVVTKRTVAKKASAVKTAARKSAPGAAA
jgi:DNA-binding protein H-NS